LAKFFIHVGHGGKDSGAVGATGLKEKDVTLNISKKIGVYLENHGQIVKLSREVDMDLNSGIAANMANQWGADYVISIHCNSATNPTATGTETFAYSTASKGKPLAEKVQKNLVNEIKLANRGVKYNNKFAILARPTAPAILVEVAFISNPREEALLKSDVFLNKIAVGISKGILEHISIPFSMSEVSNNIISTPTNIEGGNVGMQNQPSVWAREAWDWCKREGIFDGTTPKENITREQVAVIIFRLYQQGRIK